VFASIENQDRDKCVDIFFRPDGTFGFEEFHRDIEDQGEWRPPGYYSGSSYTTSEAAYIAGEMTVAWFAEVLVRFPKASPKVVPHEPRLITIKPLIRPGCAT
jgi:hypothetical protein